MSSSHEDSDGDLRSQSTYDDIFDRPESKRSWLSPVTRVVVLLVIAAFLVVWLGKSLAVFSWPSLDFLRESERLSQDPQIEALRQAVVEVKVQIDPGISTMEKRGTGFNVSANGLIVTNRHLVEDAADISVCFPGGGSYKGVHWWEDPVEDLAAILLDGKDLPVIVLDEPPPVTLGENVTIIGNPLGYSWLIMQGQVTGFWRDANSAELLEITAPIHRGNSGSPVFSAEGQVIGVVFAVIDEAGEEIRGLAVPFERLKQFVDKSDNGE